MELHIRPAGPSDAEALTEIAHAAKRHWRYPEEWIVLWREALTFTPDFIAQHPVYIAYEGGNRAGCYALSFEGSIAILEHLWVRPEWIGRGVGRHLFAHATGIAATYGATEVRIDSDPNAEAFYRRMGAQRIR